MLDVGDKLYVLTYREAKRIINALKKEDIEAQLREEDARIFVEVTKVESKGTARAQCTHN